MAVRKEVTLSWQGRELVFQGVAPGKAPILLDGRAAEGPSPMEALLLALAGCTASDVVVVLQKKRLGLRALEVEVHGQRRDEHPRRYVALDLVYRVSAPGAAEAQVRQAIDLSLAKYCSVTHSLAPDIPVRYELVLQA